MIGRKQQVEVMKELLHLHKSYFIAVTGRRRVGKTYLIDQVYKDHICFRVTGIQNGDQKTQIVNFVQKLAEFSKIPIVTVPQNWQQTFILFKKYLDTLPKKKKQVIFFDELPWMATVRSGFIQMLAHFWNDYLSKEKHFVLAICGSATSWISNKIIGDKGGFHNRISHHIHLPPFTLKETKDFLLNKKINLVNEDIAILYMILGGIPYYLELVKKGESAAETIDRICFAENGLLRTEYQHLYKALFDQPANHEAIVMALAKSKSGLNRIDLSRKSKVELGGPFSRTIEDLVQSGFIIEYQPFGKIKKGTIYKLTDEYSIFYHRFVTNHKKSVAGLWHEIIKTQAYKIWLGFAFESLCMRHVSEVKKALGISNVYTETSIFYDQSKLSTERMQIDIIIDRQDKSVNICECKFYAEPYEITKSYADTLERRKDQFIQLTATKKNVFTTLITNHTPKKNEHYFRSIDRLVLLEDLF